VGQGRVSHRVIEIRDLPENRLSVTPDRTLARNPFRANLPRRGGLRTPVMTHSASPGYAPARPPAFRLLLAGHAIPGLAYGLATRARRPRPSEKTPSASSPTFPRTAISPCLAPRRGGLRTPSRKGMRFTRACPRQATGCSLAHRLGVQCLGIRTAVRCGRTECAPYMSPANCPQAARISCPWLHLMGAV